MTPSLLARLAPLAALLALGAAPPQDVAADSLRGDRWEVTSQVSMEGMPMALPANKIKVCAKKEWTEPPGGADERRKCVNSDFVLEPPKATWKVVCAGPPAMTGTGEITRDGDDDWSGAIKMTSKDGAVTINLTGHKLGECDNPR